ncbi:MAG TPA: carbon storage regulator [Planctomycetaceae bacterium]|nr:carbon storage regulator [Planctomycetaceae bacterium]|tara:strand:- start:383 stop:604 length:222 start_codon:yes stop_codon:yes gene_type:complete
MLVLSRKTGQSIQIDDDIYVTVSQVRGGRVRLSIEAPDSVRIVRSEVLERDFGVADSKEPGVVITHEHVVSTK